MAGYYTVELHYEDVHEPTKRVDVYVQSGIGGKDFYNQIEEQLKVDFPDEEWCSWRLVGSTAKLGGVDFTDETADEDMENMDENPENEEVDYN